MQSNLPDELIADTIFMNGTILTVNEERPRATALAIRGKRILAVGGDAEMKALVGTRTRVIDLRGRTAVPGFHDAHDHMIGYGLQLNMVPADSAAAPDIDSLVAALAMRARQLPAGTWVRGAGYDNNKLLPARHPDRHDLDRASRQHPIYLRHTSGHMAVVNSRAMETLGIDRQTPDPEGGRIVRDASGEATGLLLETAMDQVLSEFYPYKVNDLIDALEAASNVYVSEGITSHTEAGIGYLTDLEALAYQRAVTSGRMRIRSTLMVKAEALLDIEGATTESAFGLSLGIASGWGDDMLRIGAVKMFSDGSLIGQTAAMRGGYLADPNNEGIFTTPKPVLRDWILRSHRSGWQIAVHAIGDLAVEFILDCYEEALNEVPRLDHRHRIEHSGMVSDAALERFVRLGVIPVPQQRFIGELGDGFFRVLPRQRASKGLYRLRSFVDRGVRVPGSSDRYVVNGAPLLGIHDAVNQLTDTGVEFAPQEALTVEQALRAFTLDSAYASFDEDTKGSLEAGKLADITVLGANPLEVDQTEIRDIPVVATMVGGEFVFGRPD